MNQNYNGPLWPFAKKKDILGCVLLGILSGAFSFLFITLVTKLIARIVAGDYNAVGKEEILLFSFVILLFIWSRSVLSRKVILLSQEIFWGLRKRILSLVLGAGYLQLATRKNRIQSAMSNDVAVMTDASLNIINFFSSMVITISCFIYMAFISFFLFLVTLLTAALGVAIYWLRRRADIKSMETARGLEDDFFKSYMSVVDGFKEIYMNRHKGKYIYEHKIQVISKTAYKMNVLSLTGLLNNSIFGQILFYSLISVILIFFGTGDKERADNIVRFVFTLIYLLGSIETIMVLLPFFIRAKVAFRHLTALEMELVESGGEDIAAQSPIPTIDFEKIAIRDLCYCYDGDKDVFSVGPVNMEIRKGDLFFIYGGNGSGKTTLINLISGLYPPSSGEINVDDVVVDRSTYSAYRSLFSVVFSDFYLFDEIAGITDPDLDKWHYYLRLFELEGKVTLRRRKLSTVDLSTGQRKRLALIVCLLEERPVLILDEWAADQDPYFRKKFYREILPLLKERGLTIIAITHDDRYFDCADWLFRMDYGVLTLDQTSIF